MVTKAPCICLFDCGFLHTQATMPGDPFLKTLATRHDYKHRPSDQITTSR